MEDGVLTISVGEVHFDINVRTLAQETVGLQILANRQNGDHKARPFESNTASFSQSRHGSFKCIYQNSQIFGTSQNAKFGEKPATIYASDSKLKISFVSM